MRFAHSLLLALCALLTACEKKGDPVEAAKSFFVLVGNGRPEEAYASAAEGFRAQQSEKFFAQTTKELGLASFTSLTAATPEFESNTARFQVEITHRDGKKSPLNVTMVEERGAWRLFSVRAPRSTQTGIAANLFGTVGKNPAFTDNVTRPMPGDHEIRALVEATLLSFNKSIQAGAFDEFYDEVSAAWQDQLTKGQLKRAFQGFIDRQVDIRYIEGKQAVFTEPPTITTDGLLLVKGQYTLKPAYVVFATKYTYEVPKWKLFGLDVSLATPPE